jgi:hypothetical protein
MKPRLFRPVEPSHRDLSPSWKPWRGLLVVGIVRVLTLLRTVCQSPRARRAVQTCLLLVGLVGQAVSLLTLAYLCDLSLSLMELWDELARKHLELTL